MTEAWIQENRADFTPVITPEESTSEEVIADLARINEDLVFIGYTIDVFADSNDMKDDFQEFKNEIDSNMDGNVTYVELNTYIEQLGDDE